MHVYWGISSFFENEIILMCLSISIPNKNIVDIWRKVLLEILPNSWHIISICPLIWSGAFGIYLHYLKIVIIRYERDSCYKCLNKMNKHYMYIYIYTICSSSY